MSADCVDDIEAAEDMAGTLAQAIRAIVLSETFAEMTTTIRAAAVVAEAWDDYCRPTCRFLEEGECQDDDPDCCGCPCDHEAKEEALDGATG